MEQPHSRPRTGIPKLDTSIPIHSKRPKLVSGIDVDRIHAGYVLRSVPFQYQRIKKPTLVEIESVDFVSGSANEGIA